MATPILSADEFSTYQTLSEKVRIGARALSQRYVQIMKEVFGNVPLDFAGRSAMHADYIGSDDNELHYEGDEFWAFGGHEFHTFTLPVAYLTDPGWEEKVRREMVAYKEQLEAKKKAEQDAKEAQEIATLQKLREKYPDQG